MPTEVTDLSNLLPSTTTALVDVSTSGSVTTYKLLDDITISTSSLALASITKNSVFDGDGHIIRYVDGNGNVSTSVATNGLFYSSYSTSYGNVTIKNINVYGGYTNGSAGFICGNAFGKLVSGSLQVTGNITIENCYSTGNISGRYSGGIVGRDFCEYPVSYYSSTNLIITISKCGTSGNISGQDAGGIAGDGSFGYLGYRNSTGTITGILDQCFSLGSISGQSSGGIGGSSFGLSLGDIATGGTHYLYVTNCYSMGDISGSYAGGIFGEDLLWYFGDSSSNGGRNYFYMTNCYSNGNVTGTYSSGGIAGNDVVPQSKANSKFYATNIYAKSGSYGNIDSPSTTLTTYSVSKATSYTDFISKLSSDDALLWSYDNSNETPILVNAGIGLQIIPLYGSSSGDPHIFPAFGKMYELPSKKERVYRMLQGSNGLILNASTKKLTKEQKNSILCYHTKNNIHVDDLLIDGVFYDKVFIYSETMSLQYDFNETELTLLCENKNQYFKVHRKENNSGKIYNNKYESDGGISQLVISFRHSKYGNIEVELNYFSNPQIKYGIGIKSRAIKELEGLLVREYICSSAECEKLNDIRLKKLKRGKNKINSELLLISKKN